MQQLMKLLAIDLDSPIEYVKIAVVALGYISTETFVVTLVLTALCMYFGFCDKSNKNLSRRKV